MLTSKIKVILSLLLIVFLLSSCTFGDKGRTYKKSFKGVIIKKYQNDKNHGMLTFDIVNNNQKFWVISERWPRCWEFAEVGDSIIKPPDTLILTIKKPNGTEKHFNYNW